MIYSKRLFFTANSAAVIKAFFECIPLSLCMLAGCALFDGVSSGFMVGNIFRMRGAIISMINLFVFSRLADSLIRVLLIKRKACFAKIGVAFTGAKVPFCSSVVRPLHFERFAAAVANSEKVIRKGRADFCSCFRACFVSGLKTFYAFGQSNHLNIILPHIGEKFNIHDNPELLEERE